MLRRVAAALLTLIPLAGLSQRLIEGTQQARNHTTKLSGVWGQVHAGLTYGFLSSLNTDLNTENALRTPALEPATEQEFIAKGLGNDFGAQLGGLIRNKWIIQGGATYREYTATQTFRGEAWLRTLQYGGNIGYAVRNRDQLLMYPYLGYYTGTSRLQIDNFHSEPIRFGDREIARASRADLEATSGTIDIGFGVQYLLGRNVDRGFTLGAQAGGYVALGGGAWNGVNGAQEAAFSGAYLRVNIGYGRFSVQREGAASGRVRKGRSVYDEDAKLDDLFQQPGGNAPDADVKRDTRNRRDFDRARQQREDARKRNKKAKRSRDRDQPLDYDDVDNR